VGVLMFFASECYRWLRRFFCLPNGSQSLANSLKTNFAEDWMLKNFYLCFGDFAIKRN
jgi:hypothetical protein